MSKDSNTLFLRNYPDDDALKNPQRYSKALSFSPDIIPLYGAKPGKDALVHPTSWRGFAGMPIVGGDVNNVYIRGHGSGGPHLATLRAFPSELILWPQVWAAVRPVSSGPVVIHANSDTAAPHASEGHLQFRPPHTTGNAYSLVANVFKHSPGNDLKGLAEYEPIPKFDENYGVDDHLAFLSKDNNLTFYNVVVADPTLSHVTVSTRLRMFGKSPAPVTFRLEWHKGTPIPAGVEASLIDDRGKINIPRASLSSLGDYKVVLDPSYDAVLTLNIYAAPGNTFFEPYSGLSLQVSKSSVGLVSTLVPSFINSSPLLGALNVIFDPHSTRNLRFASPSATRLREKNCAKDDVCHCPGKQEDCATIPVTTPATTGWWFRSAVTDQNKFPRTSPGGYSPDIQPIGTDLTVPGLWTSLENPNSDYSKDHAIELVGDENNYIFLRGHSTIADIDVQTRVFAVYGAPVLHPKEWGTAGGSIAAKVFDGDGTIDQQSISVSDADQFYLMTRPFDIKAPPNPNPGTNPTPGNQWMYHTHYCLIAEARQKRKCSLVFPDWPSEQVEDFKTAQDFTNWVASNPLVCYRNIGWLPGTRKPGDQCLTWQCSTRLVLPHSSFSSSFWTIIVECDNQIIPPGSKWSLECDDNSIFPKGICFGNMPIDAQSPYAGCHFTGAPSDQAPSNLILTVTWCDSGRKIPAPSVKITFASTEVSTLHPITHIARPPPPGSDSWPFYVGSKYPYVGNQPNPSPLPSFAAIGSNTWPYPGAGQFVLGGVALAAKPE